MVGFAGWHAPCSAVALARCTMFTRALLACGIVSSTLYAAMTLFIARQWAGYSSASQTISELSAVGAPTRPLWVPAGAVYTILVTAFGCGVWRSAGRNRPLRIAAGLIAVYGSLGLLWPLAPMHLRDALAAGGSTVSDTMHLVLAGVTVLLMLLAIGFGAAAFARRFRIYSVTTLVILFAFGALTFVNAPRVATNLPTPWVGIWERINIGLFLLWLLVLATTMLRRRSRSIPMTEGDSSAHATSPRNRPAQQASAQGGEFLCNTMARNDLATWPGSTRPSGTAIAQLCATAIRNLLQLRSFVEPDGLKRAGFHGARRSRTYERPCGRSIGRSLFRLNIHSVRGPRS